MNTESFVNVPKPIWYQETPFSPDLKEDDNEIDFRVVPAKSDQGPTVAILAKYYLGGSIWDCYGGQLPRPVHIVALNAASGNVYHRDCVKDDAPPIRVSLSANEEDEGQVYESGFLNVDLGAHLCLPPEDAPYYVFLWIDDLISPIRMAEVPENRERRESGLPSNQKSSEIVEFRSFPMAPSAAGNEIVLVSSTQSGDRTIYGAWSPDPTKVASQAPYYLTLLAFNHRDRTFGWVSVDVTKLPVGTNLNQFSVDPLKIVGASEMRQKIFVLAVSGEVMSKVLVGRLE